MATKDVARKLFEIEHARFGHKLGLWGPEHCDLTYDLTRSFIDEIERLSHSGETFPRRLCTQMAAVLWENAPQEYLEDLRQFLVIVLSRIGIAPSTVMVDRESGTTHRYGSLRTYFGQLETVINQLRCELEVCGQTYLLTEFQRDTILTIRQNKITGISAPTSSGKSFALYLTIIEHLIDDKGQVIVIVPTISLVGQVAHDLANMARLANAMDISVRVSYEPDFGTHTAFVLTQERALGLFQENISLDDATYLVVDEIQNIERVANESDQRAKILLDVLKEFKDRASMQRVVLSGPRLTNIGNLGFEIFGEMSASQDSTVSPVVSLTYSIAQHAGNYWLHQYVDTIDGPAASRKIENSAKIAGIGKAQYNNAFFDYLESLVSSLGEESRNIIFSPTALQARKTAIALAGRRAKAATLTADDRLRKLQQYLEDTVHPEYPLAATLEYGSAYHTGKVPTHVRVAIEGAYRMGIIKDLVCTTTLMQGVNLPANTVIVRNPSLFVRRRHEYAPRLSAYEFANLRGRAGRLLKDFIGRNIVLDENAFNQENHGEQDDLFADQYKELSPGYGGVFEEHAEQILSDLNSEAPADGPQKFLITYIRQTLLRMGNAGQRRLAEVGIVISPEDVARARKAIGSLSEPAPIYTKHRYWDPFDLDVLFSEARAISAPRIPNSVWTEGLAGTLREIVQLHSHAVPYYARRYLDNFGSDRYIWAICYAAEKWAREVPLRTIIEERQFDGDVGQQIESQIDLIMQRVVYGLPALLKPYAERFSPDSGVLSAIETGVHRPISRELLNLGLSRDTSIRVREGLFETTNDGQVSHDEVTDTLIRRREDLDFWTRHEVESLLGLK